MATQTATRKIKKSYTLSPDAISFVRRTREKQKIASDSEALDNLLHEIMQLLKQRQLDAKYHAYYDTVSNEALDEQNAWAVLTGKGILSMDGKTGAMQ